MFALTHLPQRNGAPCVRGLRDGGQDARCATHDARPESLDPRPAPPVALRPAMRLSARGAAAARASSLSPGAAARSVASKSVLAIGPTHGDVAPASR